MIEKKNDLSKVNLTSIFIDADAQDSHVGKRLLKMIHDSKRVNKPPFPKQIQIETSNICNHKCAFCAYTLMERAKQHMDKSLFRRLVEEAYRAGAREIGLFAGAEPLTCKWIDEYISYCKEIGYEYIYISTNGAIGNHELFKRIIDAGLNSIKFSVNAGNRESYQNIHGRDEFEKVLSNIRFVDNYRKKNNIQMYLGVSFVSLPETEYTFNSLKECLNGQIDEILYYEASNQSGQMPHLPDPPYRNCHLPFNKLHISVEGYVKACCNDYENLLAIEDLGDMSLIDAWHSPRFQALRQKHQDDNLEGTVCGNCIRSFKSQPSAINENLVTSNAVWQNQISKKNP